MSVQYFNPFDEVRRSQGPRLPHWEQSGICYFLTFRLGDSVPQKILSEWESERQAWLAIHPPPHTKADEDEYHRRFSGAIDGWLDKGLGACHLRQPSLRSLVARALNFFDFERYLQHVWVVMPNHCHCLFSLHPDWSLEKVLHSWKSYTANQINERRNSSGHLWHRDYFDRMVRSSQHFANCVRYIRNNPRKARLKPNEYTIYESEMAKQVPIRKI